MTENVFVTPRGELVVLTLIGMSTAGEIEFFRNMLDLWGYEWIGIL
jgi:hypothetical protein